MLRAMIHAACEINILLEINLHALVDRNSVRPVHSKCFNNLPTGQVQVVNIETEKLCGLGKQNEMLVSCIFFLNIDNEQKYQTG